MAALIKGSKNCICKRVLTDQNVSDVIVLGVQKKEANGTVTTTIEMDKTKLDKKVQTRAVDALHCRVANKERVVMRQSLMVFWLYVWQY